MKKIGFDVPALYGDHHVLEVKRILFELPGIDDVYASSAFKYIEIEFDPDKISEDKIRTKLENSGYFDEITIPKEKGTVAYQNGQLDAYFRHTDTLGEKEAMTINFGQDVKKVKKHLWNCPGLGIIEIKES
jgi:copper chaperone CopZ